MDPFVAEIRVFSFDFAPKGWANCDGQLMPASQNKALWAILGNLYGGDKDKFALPDLRDAAANSQGQGISPYKVGDEGGAPEVTLGERDLPKHIHQGRGTGEPAEVQSPGPDRALARSTPGYAYHGDVSQALVPMDPQASTAAGGAAPHNNMPPSLVLRFCIALQGVYPDQ